MPNFRIISASILLIGLALPACCEIIDLTCVTTDANPQPHPSVRLLIDTDRHTVTETFETGVTGTYGITTISDQFIKYSGLTVGYLHEGSIDRMAATLTVTWTDQTSNRPRETGHYTCSRAVPKF